VSATSTTIPARLAPALNASCQCIWLDRDRLRAQLHRELGDAGALIESRPGLVSGSVVFVDPQDAAAMDRAIELIRRALSSGVFQRRVEAHAPPIARVAGGAAGFILGFDFHLGGPEPQLIEINTNPGGLLVNLELARALTAACDCLTAPLPSLAAGNVALEDVPRAIADAFRSEWNATRGDASLHTIVIADDDPAGQYLYPEFLLFQRLLERCGWRSLIAEAERLETSEDGLIADGTPVDLVYNRLTDFYLDEGRHSVLRQACSDGTAVIVPSPAQHARWADKRLLAWLRDDDLLQAAGLDADERSQLKRWIPPTEIVARDAAQDLWRRRKDLFFKPVDGYGSKAAYRGDKLTRATFEHILSHPYVAQAIAPTSVRRVPADGSDAELRVDVRCYDHHGQTLLRAARLYRGQTTNFRTPGGGFAPVLTLPALDAERPLTRR
jgi:hypothetical protein